MISQNQYADIELQQNADFQMTITLDSSHTMTSNHKYAAVIVKDYKHSAFTGPAKTNNGHVNGTASANDTWGSGSQNEVHFDIVADRGDGTVVLTLPAEAIQYFDDDFEGHWDLVEQDDQAQDAWVRHIQGDVYISKAATKLSHTFTASVE
jgi:hypothetical protein